MPLGRSRRHVLDIRGPPNSENLKRASGEIHPDVRDADVRCTVFVNDHGEANNDS